MQIYHSLTVDVAKRNQYKAVSAKQLDCNSRFLKIELQNNGSAFDIPNNVTIAMAVERNGETKAFNCTYKDNYIVAPLDTWILQESGYVDCEIILLDTETNSKLSSFLFSLEIEQNIYNDEDIKSDKNYDLLLSLIGDVKSSQIVSITEKVNGLKHTYTVLFGSGESKEFVLSDGAKGDKGDPGTPGKDGAPGKDGYTPIKGVDYSDGAKGEKGDKGEKGEQGIQGLPGVNGKDGVDGKNATINGKNVINILAGDNINLEESGENIKISASCVMKPLKLSVNANSPTLLPDIGAGAFIVINTGYIRTSGGFQKAIGKGAELIIVKTIKDNISQLCVTVQTGTAVLLFWDMMSADMQNEIFISTLSVKNDLSSLTDRNVMSGTFARTMFEERIKKSEVGNGLKFADGKLQLDIPVATADTGYGG
nr:MAG TPA: BppU domain protein [Caudoviricetes sp.]